MGCIQSREPMPDPDAFLVPRHDHRKYHSVSRRLSRRRARVSEELHRVAYEEGPDERYLHRAARQDLEHLSPRGMAHVTICHPGMTPLPGVGKKKQQFDDSRNGQS
jgi:hypothetical protein